MSCILRLNVRGLNGTTKLVDEINQPDAGSNLPHLFKKEPMQTIDAYNLANALAGTVRRLVSPGKVAQIP